MFISMIYIEKNLDIILKNSLKSWIKKLKE